MQRRRNVMNSRKVLLVLATICICLCPNIGVTQTTEPQLVALDATGMKALLAHPGSQIMQLDLLWFRGIPSTLDDPRYMRYFIQINNCTNPKLGYIEKSFHSEFDYPTMVAFYKKKETEILQSVPYTTIGLLNQVYADPRNPQRASMIDLGEYDVNTGTFPIVDSNNKRLTVDLDGFMGGGRAFNCGTIQVIDNQFPFSYSIRFPKVSFTEFKVDEAIARKYVSSPGVGGPGMGRSVALEIDVEILPGPPQVIPVALQNGRPDITKGPQLVFPSKLKRVAVLDSNRHELGVLYQ
jgi:hypothetical protein